MPQRYFVEFAYHGAAYHGWQKQTNATTVQAIMEDVLSKLLAEETQLIAAGRTDTGVHARQMWAHFDTPEKLSSSEQFAFRLNAFLPADIAVKRVCAVPEDAHARFSATKRSYRYYVHYKKSPFLSDRSWYLRKRPNTDKMDEAAELIKAFDDFSAFARSNDAATHHRCHIFESMWEHRGEGSVYLIQANRFVRNMVRAIVGTLMEVGYEKCDTAALRSIVESGDRRRAGESAPAHGLFLEGVEYPEDLRACLM